MQEDSAENLDWDERVRELVRHEGVRVATNETLRVLGPEVLGFLTGVLRNDADADEVFVAVCERLWRSLETFGWRCSLRSLLMLRVDRRLAWNDVALAFVDEPETCTEGERDREVQRLRKGFQLLKVRLTARARAEGITHRT